MSNYPVLSHERTMELISQAQQGSKEAMETLINHNTRLVWSVVQRFQSRGYEPDDLFQIGAIGLMKSVNKFDMSFNVKFSTYSVPLMVGEIQRHIRDDGPVKVPRSIKEFVVKIAREELQEATAEHVAKVFEVELDFAKLALQYIRSRNTTRSMEERVFLSDDGDDITLKEKIGGDVNSAHWVDYIALREAIGKLAEEEKKIIELRFFRDLTQVEAAKELGTHQVQVSRLEKKILAKMRDIMEVKELPTCSPNN